ncbi:TerB N-terminal domain-containing protein [Collinsella tanakaei]|uniref:TerB N-terminal domain-containing protein n=1 Tax=Collinsella tanakaei TaxID=626935 RepID=UPI0019567E7F|nr:TerB N-terminal domain-containing protein [Collinsella tanakaei]MBM6755981.1 TerB N-terminal domain-containing protein [Collinsella tanakaei]
MADAQDIIDRLMNDERFQRVARFSNKVYADEPILTTGRQMKTYLPDRYREMRAISRWQPGREGGQGRWLSEAELFYRQGMFMADFEDDCPYHGTFKSYYPTYNAMSDRQLRGYFTWRAAVRRGTIEETSLSFAYVYLYELICGIGVEGGADGFGRLSSFWRAYREFSPEIDRFARVWLQDYVVYHGLDPKLVADQKGMRFDRAVAALIEVQTEALGRAGSDAARAPRRSAKQGTLLPPDPKLEGRLAHAVDTLSTYRILDGKFGREHPEAVCHVVTAVWVQLHRYYDKHRKAGIIESLFGESAELPYTMFASAVFFDPVRHPDTEVALNPLCHFRCKDGLWTCDRLHGSRSRSAKLGEVLRTIDRSLRNASSYPHPLKDEKIPRYLEQIVEREVAAWLAWSEAHAPRHIDIDLSKLSGIRAVAAETREALLIDEEREDTPINHDDALVPNYAPAGSTRADQPAKETAPGPSNARPVPPAPASNAAARPDPAATFEAQVVGGLYADAPQPASEPTEPQPAPDGAHPLTPAQQAYLAALCAGDTAAAARALDAANTTEDLFVDAINEALFDLIGDTAIEFGTAGPEPVEDYLPDIEELLHHA